MSIFSDLKKWFSGVFHPPPPSLSRMRLGPDDRAHNPLMIQFFSWDILNNDMSWWSHLENEIPRLAAMGFTQIWLPPPNKAAHKGGRGYDAYDLWDIGEFDQKGSVGTRWGTRDELLRACRVAKEHNVDILIDAVLNHKMGGDRCETFSAVPVNPHNRLEVSGKARQVEGWTAFDFPGRRGKYSSFRWTQEHFSGLDWDQKTRSNGVFRIEGRGHRGWSKHVDKELGNYDYLMGADIDYRHPDVQEDTLRWSSWILETTGAVGFRLDAIKHIDQVFLHNFLRSTRATSGNSRMFAVSEYWSGDLKMILPYIKAFKGETAFFDVPLHMNFHQASIHYSRYDLRTILNNTIIKVKPGDAVTFVDNHDTVVGQTLESWVGDNFKVQAYAIILLRGVGYPCIFYADLYPNSEVFSENVSRNLVKLIEVRNKFSRGPLVDYPQEKNCIGFVRTGGCAVLLSNRDDSNYVHTIRMNVGQAHANTVFRSYLSDGGEVAIDAEGWGDFTCFAGWLQVWVPSHY